MRQRYNFSAEQKLNYVLRWTEGRDSLHRTASLAGISVGTLRRWIFSYQTFGIKGLDATSKNFRYPATLKEMAVKDYLDGIGSHSAVCKKYGIKSEKQLRVWILKYNGHEKLNASRTGGILIMTEGRNTTYDERVEIIKYCIEHGNNYAETTQKYQVSYNQVYTWVRKYKKSGIEALQDRRGKRKGQDEMSELEKLKARNKLLEAENQKKQMEIDFLKKLEEIEGRRF